MTGRWKTFLTVVWLAASVLTVAVGWQAGLSRGGAVLAAALVVEALLAAAVHFFMEYRLVRPAARWREALLAPGSEIPPPASGLLSPVSDAVLERFERGRKEFENLSRENSAHAQSIDSLEKELAETRGHLMAKIRELRGIYEVTTVLTGSLDLDDLFSILPERVMDVLGIHDFCILLFQQDTRRLVCKAGAGVPGGWSLAAGEGVSGKVFLSGEPTYLPDVRAASEFLYYGGARTDLRSFVCIPLLSRGKPIGVLNIHHSEPNAFDAESIATMRVLAVHIAVAIENAGMFQFVRTLAEKDSLTMLYNHGAFHERLHIELERANRYMRHLSVIMLDLDAFKEVNDQHGHIAGDRILSMTAAVLCAHLRKSDIPARYGGDEFAVILPETDLAAASTIASRIAAGISQVRLETEKGGTISFTASIGYATCAPDSPGREEILSVADRLMYESKRRGKGGVLGEQI